MLSQHGVSRESLREALRILEVQGLITIHRGPGGGPKVAGVDPAYLARTAKLYFHLSGATYEEVFETWPMLQPAVAEKVAGLPDRAHVRQTLEPYTTDRAAAAPGDRSLPVSTGFHAALAELSGNRVLALIQQAITYIVVDHVMMDLDPAQEPETLEQHHRAIAAAIAAGRATKSRSLTADDIRDVIASTAHEHPDA